MRIFRPVRVRYITARATVSPFAASPQVARCSRCMRVGQPRQARTIVNPLFAVTRALARVCPSVHARFAPRRRVQCVVHSAVYLVHVHFVEVPPQFILSRPHPSLIQIVTHPVSILVQAAHQQQPPPRLRDVSKQADAQPHAPTSRAGHRRGLTPPRSAP